MDAYNSYQVAFGKQVRSLRMQRGLTQEEVAHRAGIHVTYLSGVERGVRNPSLKNIRSIAQALRVFVQDLFVFEHTLELPAPDHSKFSDNVSC